MLITPGAALDIAVEIVLAPPLNASVPDVLTNDVKLAFPVKVEVTDELFVKVVAVNVRPTPT